MKSNTSIVEQYGRYMKKGKKDLQARMTVSYVWVTVLSVLALELLVFMCIALVVNPFFAENNLKQIVREQAQVYALEASIQGKGSNLDTRTTFLPGQPETIALPGKQSNGDILNLSYVSMRYPDTQPQAFVLLIDPSGQVLASSYPGRYPSQVLASTLLPNTSQMLNKALAGISASAIVTTSAGQVFCVSETIWSWRHIPIGLIYLQVPTRSSPNILWPFASILLISGILLPIALAPVGGLFGRMTTRGIIQRIHHLVILTAQFATGNYTQRVLVAHTDEVGQLEQQLNQMADQLAASIARQQELASHNARLEERARISRELHDAISQDLFSLRMLAYGLQEKLPKDSNLQASITILEQTTTNAIRELRALLLEMRPIPLEHLKLSEALEEIAKSYQTRLGLTVTTTITSMPFRPQIEHVILRIVQEALTNAVRHAHATHLTLSLVQDNQQGILSITDNGAGFTPDSDQGYNGLGLRLMQERVQQIGGTFTLQSVPEEGTCIRVCFPQEMVND